MLVACFPTSHSSCNPADSLLRTPTFFPYTTPSIQLSQKHHPKIDMLWSLLTAFVFAGVHGAAAAGPSGCVSFDINWNLLAFGFNGKDFNAGTQDTWTTSSGMFCHLV